MNGERLVEEFVEADLGDVSADQQPSPPWSDAERDTVVRLAEGDSAAFLARAREDPGFPFEPAAITALLRFAKDRRADWQRLRAQLKAEPKIHLSALEAVMKAEVRQWRLRRQWRRRRGGPPSQIRGDRAVARAGRRRSASGGSFKGDRLLRRHGCAPAGRNGSLDDVHACARSA